MYCKVCIYVQYNEYANVTLFTAAVHKKEVFENLFNLMPL